MLFRIHLDPDLDHCFEHNKLLLLLNYLLFSGHGQRINRRGGGSIPHCTWQAAIHSSNRQVGHWNFLRIRIVCVNILPGKLLFTRPIGRKKVPIGRHNFSKDPDWLLYFCIVTALHSFNRQTGSYWSQEYISGSHWLVSNCDSHWLLVPISITNSSYLSLEKFPRLWLINCKVTSVKLFYIRPNKRSNRKILVALFFKGFNLF